MGTPLDEARRRAEGPREALKVCIGLGVGLIPAACAILFAVTQCPVTDTACHQPTNGIDVGLFVGVFYAYILQGVATATCFIWRATRPIALGLLIMLIVGPLVALVGVTYVFMQKAPHTTNFSANPMLGSVIANFTEVPGGR